MSDVVVNGGMLEAGLQALLAIIPAETLEQQDVDPRQLVISIYRAMAPHQWNPIATARLGATENVILGCFLPQGFMVGIGRYVPADDDTGTGRWSTESWWGRPPSHWMPMLPQPPKPEVPTT